MITLLITALLFLAAYLIGSIPSAIIVCRCMRLPDPRESGSHNPGTTNVLRIGGKKAAIFTLAADLLKGLLPVLLARLLGGDLFLAGFVLLAAFLGHLFPVFARFQGGKGVATLLGGLLALSLPAGIAAVLTWLIIAAVTRYSSLSAMIAAVLTPVYGGFFTKTAVWIPLTVLALLLLWRHKKNIERLVKGTESKIGQSNQKASNDSTF
ncbi:MAG: plsY [Gammaproteobacteria bacterium]|nr:plsY [Gammaproteobacteria bacterium]